MQEMFWSFIVDRLNMNDSNIWCTSVLPSANIVDSKRIIVRRACVQNDSSYWFDFSGCFHVPILLWCALSVVESKMESGKQHNYYNHQLVKSSLLLKYAW